LASKSTLGTSSYLHIGSSFEFNTKNGISIYEINYPQDCFLYR